MYGNLLQMRPPRAPLLRAEDVAAGLAGALVLLVVELTQLEATGSLAQRHLAGGRAVRRARPAARSRAQRQRGALPPVGRPRLSALLASVPALAALVPAVAHHLRRRLRQHACPGARLSVFWVPALGPRRSPRRRSWLASPLARYPAGALGPRGGAGGRRAGPRPRQPQHPAQRIPRPAHRWRWSPAACSPAWACASSSRAWTCPGSAGPGASPTLRPGRHPGARPSRCWCWRCWRACGDSESRRVIADHGMHARLLDRATKALDRSGSRRLTRRCWAAPTATTSTRWSARAPRRSPGNGVDEDCDGQDGEASGEASRADRQTARQARTATGRSTPRPSLDWHKIARGEQPCAPGSSA